MAAKCFSFAYCFSCYLHLNSIYKYGCLSISIHVCSLRLLAAPDSPSICSQEFRKIPLSYLPEKSRSAFMSCCDDCQVCIIYTFENCMNMQKQYRKICEIPQTNRTPCQRLGIFRISYICRHI